MHTKAVKNKIWLPQRKKHYNYLWIAKLAKFLSQICPCIIARTKFPIYIVRGESENWKYRRIKYPSSTARWHFLSEKKTCLFILFVLVFDEFRFASWKETRRYLFELLLHPIICHCSTKCSYPYTKIWQMERETFVTSFVRSISLNISWPFLLFFFFFFKKDRMLNKQFKPLSCAF